MSFTARLAAAERGRRGSANFPGYKTNPTRRRRAAGRKRPRAAGLRPAPAAGRAPPRGHKNPTRRCRVRELRDRWLEHVNADASALASEGKYDVSRRIEHRDAGQQPRLLAG